MLQRRAAELLSLPSMGIIGVNRERLKEKLRRSPFMVNGQAIRTPSILKQLLSAQPQTTNHEPPPLPCYTPPMAKPRPCPSPCNVLLSGGGGREHTLGWKMKQSTRMRALWLSDGAGPPANAGLAALGQPCPLAMDARDPFRMQRWCDSADIHLVVVGPEAPLAAGIVD